jgi:hypothetical protein
MVVKNISRFLDSNVKFYFLQRYCQKVGFFSLLREHPLENVSTGHSIPLVTDL